MCLGVDTRAKPLNPTTEFHSRIGEILCVLSNAPG